MVIWGDWERRGRRVVLEKMKESSTGNEEDSGAEVNSYHSQTGASRSISAKISLLTRISAGNCHLPYNPQFKVPMSEEYSLY